MMLLVAIACLLAGATIGALAVACCAAGRADELSESALKAQGNQIRQCGEALVECGQRLIDVNDPQQRADFVKALEQPYFPRRGEL